MRPRCRGKRSKSLAVSDAREPVDACIPTGIPDVVPSEPSTQVAFRLSDRLLSRIDRHIKRLGRQQPGVSFTRVDAVRDLLMRALDQVEGNGKDADS